MVQYASDKLPKTTSSIDLLHGLDATIALSFVGEEISKGYCIVLVLARWVVGAMCVVALEKIVTFTISYFMCCTNYHRSV